MGHNTRELKASPDPKKPSKPKDKLYSVDGEGMRDPNIQRMSWLDDMPVVIPGNTMGTTGYGDIPLYVQPNNGQPGQYVPANSGDRYFPGATNFTEYPQMQAMYGGDPSIPDLTQQKKGGLVKNKKRETSQNIQSSINILMRRNEPLFGKYKRGFYNPKMEEGGWLDQYQPGGGYNTKSWEPSIDKFLGYPMTKGAVDANYKGSKEMLDNVRHAAAGRYTAEAIKNYAKLIPFVNTLPGLPSAAGFLGSNALGLGHEISTLYEKNEVDNRPWDVKIKESAADAYNNMVGSAIGISNFSPDQKKAYIQYLSETGKIPTGEYHKTKDPTYKNDQGVLIAVKKAAPAPKAVAWQPKPVKKTGGWLDDYQTGGPAWQDEGSKKLAEEREDQLAYLRATTKVPKKISMDTSGFQKDETAQILPSKYKAQEQAVAAGKTAQEGYAEKVYNEHQEREALKKRYPGKSDESIKRTQERINSPWFNEPSGQIASYLTRGQGLSDDEMASLSGDGAFGNRLGIGANMATYALANEVGGKLAIDAIAKAAPYIKKGAQEAAHYLPSIKSGKLTFPEYVNVARIEPAAFHEIPKYNPALTPEQNQFHGRWLESDINQLPEYLTGPQVKKRGPMQVLTGRIPKTKLMQTLGSNLPDAAKLMSYGPGEYGTWHKAAQAGEITPFEARMLQELPKQPEVLADPHFKKIFDDAVAKARANPKLIQNSEYLAPQNYINKLRTRKAFASENPEEILQHLNKFQNRQLAYGIPAKFAKYSPFEYGGWLDNI